MLNRLITLLFTIFAISPAALAQRNDDAGNVDLPRYPSISPDGSQIVFSWRGDLWRTSSQGDEAIRLTAHPASETRSAWSSDGSLIAFESDRDGFQNIHLMTADGTNVRQITNTDRPCDLAGFGTNAVGAQVILFSASIEGDVYRSLRPYWIALEGGEIHRVHDAFGSEPSVNDEGDRVVFVRGGYYTGFERRDSDGPETMDLWVHSRADNSFTQITNARTNEGLPRFVGNDTILFLHDPMDAPINVYRLRIGTNGEDQPLDISRAERLTRFDDGRGAQWLDVSADGSTAVVSSWDMLYRIDLDGNNSSVTALTIHANEDEADNYEIKRVAREISEAKLSPDGKVMAFVAYGELYVRNVEERSVSRRITESHARERDVAWSPDGLKLYFTSDRDGNESIYAARVALTRSEVKEEFEKATKPKRDAAEDDEEDELPAAPPASAPVTEPEPEPEPDPGPPPGQPVEPPAAPQTPGSPGNPGNPGTPGNPGNPGSPTDPPTEPPADPGAAPVEPAADEPTASDDDAKEEDDDKKDEKKKDVPKEYQPERWHDAIAFTIEPVIEGDSLDSQPSPSPDGKYLAFRRGRGDLMLRNLETGEERSLFAHWDPWSSWRWSPDGRHIAFARSDLDFNEDIFIEPVDGSAPPVNITRHPDNDTSPRWSADGKIVAFLSERVNEEFDVWMVYLDRDLEALTPQELANYYDEAAKAAGKRKPLEVNVPEQEAQEETPASEEDESQNADTDDASDDDAPDDEESDDGESDEDEDEDAAEAEDDGDQVDALDLDDAWLRIRRVTTWSGNEGDLELTPGGDRYLFSGIFGEEGIYSIKWNGEERKRLAENGSVQQVSLTGDKLVFVSRGRTATVPPSDGKTEWIDIDGHMRIDLQQQASQKFHEAARTLGIEFYHHDMKGIDWDALSERYHDLALHTRTAHEFNYVASWFLGELTASHLGVRSATGGYNSPNALPHGRLGVDVERIALADGGVAYRVTKVIPHSPAATGPMALQEDDEITAIELEPFTGTDTLLSRLEGRVGEETLVTIRRSGLPDVGAQDADVAGDGGGDDDGAAADENNADHAVATAPGELHVLLTPVNYNRMRELRYEAWRSENAQKVSEWSDGKLGYIHVEGMSQPSLDVFERDLFAAAQDRQGLIIDVRSNGGGWTSDRMLSSIMVTPHAYTIPRGADMNDVGHYPQDRLFIQRYTMPINTLCNEKSFSNAEIFSHAFKTLKRGTLVGEQTWGGVISTGAFTLIDGSFVRLPFRGWFLTSGADMENNGAMPDLRIPQLPADEAAGEDAQLRAAVEDLLKRVNE